MVATEISSSFSRPLFLILDPKQRGTAGKDLQGSCALNVGASGGGVFLRGEGRVYLGVISRGDGESRSIFVPLGRFERELRPYL